MNEKNQEILNDLVSKITGETISGFFKKTIFGSETPMKKWSLLNQLFCYIHGTGDARGYRQWTEAGRYVKKGAKAIRILTPRTIKKTVKEKDESGKEVDVTYNIVIDYNPIPVFRYEDTDGKELDYIAEMREIDLAALPLYQVAAALDVKILVGATTFGEAGSFSPVTNQIRICTDSEQTFYHELSHAIDSHLHPEFKEKYDYNLGEVVAELTACFLASLYNQAANIAYTQKYIRGYAGKEGFIIIAKALDRVKAIYEYIENWEANK